MLSLPRLRAEDAVVPLSASESASPDAVRGACVSLIGIGLVACALVYFGPASFGFERFSVPKEFVLALSATSALVLFLSDGRAFKSSRALLALSGLLVVGCLATWRGVTSEGYAVRSLSALISAVTVFLLAFALATEGHGPRLLKWAALATVLAALSALGEALHLLPVISMSGRGPGGTAGNRNFLSHFLVIGAVPLALTFVEARGKVARAAWALGFACVVAIIAVSRSRGSWLTSSIVLVGVAAVLAAKWRSLSRDARRTSAVLAVAITVAVPVGVFLIARGLNWTFADFRSSLAHLVDFRTGTGHGRLLQYQATLTMLRDHPVAGVGPGQWSIAYPRYAGPGDPYYPANSPVPFDRLPSSDWVGFASQHGLLLLLVVVALGATLAGEALRRGLLRDRHATALAAALVAQLVLGVFDSVLFRADTVYIAALSIGTLAGSCADEVFVLRAPRAPALGLALVLSVTLVALCGRRVAAWSIRSDGRLPNLERSLSLDRSNFVLASQIAQIHSALGHCDDAKAFARAALDACPTASLPKKILLSCGSLQASLSAK
ncbi:MAG TPA: O-antigen ligase family protein [Polyangiaceae bacterium]|nr:O-antigen ligase family protein [Polyangiaceae bacterium]